MKLPWVRRAGSDEVVRHLEHERDMLWRSLDAIRSDAKADAERHERDMVRSETRYAELMLSYRMLRLNGYADPAAIPPASVAAPEDLVEMAVNRAARGMPVQMRADMMAAARKMEETMPVEVVVERIQRGYRPMDDLT